jgi:predicted DNA-binding transcriptional regulator YafY
MAGEMGLLRRAISEERVLRFGYTRADGERTRRDVRPLGLYFWGNRWTLAAWCELRRDYRSFRPDRMADLELLELRFDASQGPSLEEFLRRAAREESEESRA